MRNLSYIWRLARFRFGLYLLSGSMDSFLLYLLPLVPALIVRQFFNALTGQRPAAFDAWTLLALLLAVAVINLVALIVGGVIEVSAQQIAAALMRTNVLRQVLGYPGARALPASPGEAISRLRNDVQYVYVFLTWTLDPLGQIAVLIAALVVVAKIDPRITVVIVVPVVVVVTLVNFATRRIQRYRQASQEAIGDVTGLIGDAFAGVATVKAAGAEDNVVTYLRTLNEARRRATVNDQVFSQLISSVSANTADLGTGALLLVAAGAIRSGQFTIGDFALVVSYLGFLTRATSGLGEFLRKLRQTDVSFNRLEAMLPDAPANALVRPSAVFPKEFRSAQPVSAGEEINRFEQLEAVDVCYRYPESGRGIERISLGLRRGTLSVVTGRVGSGKTTLLRVLLGLLTREAGVVCWNGRPIDDLAAFMVAPRVAYTPQVPHLFSEPLRENVLLGVPDRDHVLDRALQLAVLERDLAQFEGGLDTLVGPRGTRLSGGQVQRTAAARMFVREAELLVVDDLSSALDVDTEQTLWDGLLVQPDLTICAVSHRRSLLRRADQIIVLHDGRLEATGPFGDLFESCAEFRRIWRGEEEMEAVERKFPI